MQTSYAELHCLSNFTFLRGASHPEELVERAAELGYAGLALTDECSVAGVVRAHCRAREQALELVVGTEIATDDGLELVVLAADREAYAVLCGLVTDARRAAAKGAYRIGRDAVAAALDGSSCLVLWTPSGAPELETARWLRERVAVPTWLAVELHATQAHDDKLAACRRVAAQAGLRLVASGNVRMHCRTRRALENTLTAIRLNRPVEQLGFALHPNADRVLRPLAELERIYPAALLEETLAILERIDFSLDELRYEYPAEIVPAGRSPAEHLRALTEHGAHERWPAGVPEKVLGLIEHELKLIAELAYEPYFLTVHDLVGFARRRGILCQGRGSAANSAVCYCLGITEVDPSRMQLLMERFISKERNEPPDIDVDFEHERREEVIQYIYEKYSRRRAALAATVITYRPRSAVRDVGKALGLSAHQIEALTQSVQWWDEPGIDEDRLREAGLHPPTRKIRLLVGLVRDLIGFPRHLSQHVGGFVISERAIHELVPIENAAMADRTVIQWDKDDLDELGLLKVDVLGLGMLTAIRRSFDLVAAYRGRRLAMQDIPAEDPVVYEMIGRADTVGVFQIESRAQMAMLPRLKPRCYYDLVIEVAIIRPGPIQGDMVHPYLRRRNGEERVEYPSAAVESVLRRTLGVPIFQEQVMQLAIVAAGFTPGEADRLRRAMAAWRRRGDLDSLEQRLIEGMLGNGYSREFAERIFDQIRGFGEYGFPESHAASFALLVYVSAWLKCHEPAAFFCALLNSQPMGFYAPAQLVRAARAAGVEVRPVDIGASDWDSALEPGPDGAPAIRLGLRLVNGLGEAAARRLVAARAERPFRDAVDLRRRTECGERELGALAAADALRSLSKHRYRARWDVAGTTKALPLLETDRIREGLPMLRAPTEGADIAADYRYLGLSLRRHPLALLRERLEALGVDPAAPVAARADGERVRAAGLVITRQRPASAAGVTFVTVEDETGHLNVIVWERVAERYRRALLGAALLVVDGKLQKEGQVVHVVAERLEDASGLLGSLVTRSRDFH